MSQHGEAVKKVSVAIYLLLLVVFSLSSVSIAHFDYQPAMAVLDAAVDFTIICGVILYLRGKRPTSWRFFFPIAVVGESVLLYGDSKATLEDIVIWTIILLPAFYMNFRVAFPRNRIGGAN